MRVDCTYLSCLSLAKVSSLRAIVKEGQLPHCIPNDLLSEVAITGFKVLKVLIFEDLLILHCEHKLGAC